MESAQYKSLTRSSNRVRGLAATALIVLVQRRYSTDLSFPIADQAARAWLPCELQEVLRTSRVEWYHNDMFARQMRLELLILRRLVDQEQHPDVRGALGFFIADVLNRKRRWEKTLSKHDEMLSELSSSLDYYLTLSQVAQQFIKNLTLDRMAALNNIAARTSDRSASVVHNAAINTWYSAALLDGMEVLRITRRREVPTGLRGAIARAAAYLGGHLYSLEMRHRLRRISGDVGWLKSRERNRT